MVKVNNWFSLVSKRPTFSHSCHQHLLEMTNLCEEDTICSGCNILIVSGRNYYTCKICNDFSLHRPCYKLPTTLQHDAEPGHALNLRLMQSFECRACGLQGSGFSYNRSDSLVHYHTDCILTTPLTKKHSSHRHKLKLEFSHPHGYPTAFCCAECGNDSYDHWRYRCNKCDLDFHLICVTTSAGRAQHSPPQNPANSNNLMTSGAPPAGNPSTNNPLDLQSDQPGSNDNDQGACTEGGKRKNGDVVTSFIKGFSEGVGQETARIVSTGVQALVKKITGR